MYQTSPVVVCFTNSIRFRVLPVALGVYEMRVGATMGAKYRLATGKVTFLLL